MKKVSLFLIGILLLISLSGCGDAGFISSEREADTHKRPVSHQSPDYPPVIMVEGLIYLYQPQPVPGEVEESAVIGYTSSYTDTFPTRDGETNFSRELGLPYARVEEGIALLYQEEWRLCTPYNG